MTPLESDGQEEDRQELTQLLNRMQAGDRDAAERAMPLVYNELHKIAAKRMRREPPGHPLQATALIHEAYARLASSDSVEFQNRSHYYALASLQMRRVLVDIARAENSEIRGGPGPKLSLDRVQVGVDEPDVDLILLDRALAELEQVDRRAAKVLELRYFGGFKEQEVVEALEISLSTVRRDWEFARVWLFGRMQGVTQS